MSDKAHSGSELAQMSIKLMIPGRWYLGREVYDLLVNSDLLNDGDFELHIGGTEEKSYRRTQNGLRDAVKNGKIERNKYSPNVYQYRVPN